MGEVIFLLLLIVAGGYYFFETLGYTVGKFDTTGGGGTFPRAILVCLFVFVVLRLLEILIKKQKAPFKFFGFLQGTGGVFFLSFVAFVVLIRPLGFIIDALIFMLWSINYLYYKANDDRSLGGIKAVAVRSVFVVIYVLAVYWFFSNALSVNLPAGLLKNIL